MDTYYILEKYLQRPSEKATWSFGHWFNKATGVNDSAMYHCSNVKQTCKMILMQGYNTIPDLLYKLDQYNKGN